MRFLLLMMILAGLAPGAEMLRLKVGAGGFPSLQAARDHIRTLKRDRPIEVTIQEGRYPFSKAITFTPKDSGTKDFPITYQGEGRVVFDGAKAIPLDDLSLVSDAKTLARLTPSAHGKVVRISISDPSLTKILSDNSAVGTFLMHGSRLLPPSRFPNVGFAHAAKMIRADQPTRFQNEINKGTWEMPNGAIFTLREKPAGTWKQWQKEIEDQRRAITFGYLCSQWFRETIPLRSVSPDKGHIELITESRYGLEHMIDRFQSRHAFHHLICEIDSPGEWYFDPKENNLYLWLTSPIDKNHRLSIAAANGFLKLQKTKHLHFKNFTIQGVVDNGIIEIDGGSNNSLKGCTLRNSSTTAISLSGENNLVHGCDVYDVSRLARITGGRVNSKEITAGNNEISNCHFFLDQLSGVAPTVGLSGTGNRFLNNLMHNLTGQALVFRGNDHLIARNEFFNIGFEEGDGATIYSGAQFWGYGTRIENNFLHHIMSTDGLMTRSGIMLDDHDSGREIIGNIFYKAGHGSLAINGGTGHEIRDNVFIKGNYGVWVRVIGNVKQRIADLKKFGTGELRRGDKHDYIWRCEQAVGSKGWNSQPWTKYPTFAKVMNQPNDLRFYPIENKVSNTIGWAMNESRSPDHQKYEFNSGLTYGHPQIPKGALVFKNSRTVNPAEIFEDPDRLDFRQKRDAPSWAPKIPFSDIGLYLNEYRSSMPNKSAYRQAVRKRFGNRASSNRSAKYDFDKVNKTIYWNSGSVLKTMNVSQ